MNELRWILLGIGALIIAGIYLFEVFKQKRNIRSRVEKYPGFNHESISSLSINPKKEKNIDISGALTAFNNYLKQARNIPGRSGRKTERINSKFSVDELIESGIDDSKQKTGDQKTDQYILVLYITANKIPSFNGNDILEVMESAEMHYGDMKIFHYHGPDRQHSSRALFSIANLHEPGTFDIDNMDTFVTDGLAMFMCLPAEIGGDIAFEIMLDTARNIADQLGGELRNVERHLLDTEALNALREIASKY